MVLTAPIPAHVAAAVRFLIGGTNRIVAYKEAFNKPIRWTPALMFLERVFSLFPCAQLHFTKCTAHYIFPVCNKTRLLKGDFYL